MERLHLTLLGGFQLLRDDSLVKHFRSDKVRGLLAYLATECDRSHTRAALAALFWPDQPDELALRNLSQSLVRLREALGPAGEPALQITRHTISWRSEVVAADVSEFTRLAAGDSIDDLEAAATRYSGEFLAGFTIADCEPFEEWQLLTREQITQLALSALERLAALRLERGEVALAAAVARRQIALDPWRETAYQQLMRALAAAGDRAAALVAYERCRQALLEGIGVEPDAATSALAEQIRVGQASAAPARPAAGLPTPLTPLIGREEELAQIDGLLRGGARLLAVTGAGGVGKTRLGLATASALRDAFADGVSWVPLAGLAAGGGAGAEADRLAAAVLGALGQRPGGQRSPREDLIDSLRPRRLLLVLDNCEHLPAAGPLAAELLEAAPRLVVIATSRERLGVYGEEVLALTGLPLPEDEANLANSAAVQLFLARARRQIQGFGEEPGTMAAVARLCRMLEGMPLGIELAAHWVGEYTPDEIAEAVQADIAFLASRDSNVPDRHRSLRAVFSHSWDLLSEEERRVLARLAIFAGGFDRAAALAVAEARATVLAALADKSLLRRAGVRRYNLHELLRRFASERLGEMGSERASVEARHSAYYLAFVADRTLPLQRADAPEVLAETLAEVNNIAQAWQRAVAASQHAGLDAAAYGMALFCWHAGLSREGAGWLAHAASHLEAEAAASPEAQGLLSKLMALRARLLLPQGRTEEAAALGERALAIGAAAGSGEGEAYAAMALGMALRRRGETPPADRLLRRAAELSRHLQEQGDQRPSLPDIERLSFNWLASIAISEDRYDDAGAYAERSLELCRRLGIRHGELYAISDTLDVAIARGEYELARAHVSDGLRLARDLRMPEGEVLMLWILGELHWLGGEYGAAQTSYERAIELARARADLIRESSLMGSMCRLYLSTGDFPRARQWIERAERMLRAANMPARDWALLQLRRAQVASAHGEHTKAIELAEDGVRRVQELDGMANQSAALSILGAVCLAAGARERAAQAFEQALARAVSLSLPHRAAEARTGLILVALDAGQLAQALAHVEALPLHDERARARMAADALLAMYWACYRALALAGDPLAPTAHAAWSAEIQRQAASIADPAWREIFQTHAGPPRARNAE